ncbi:MAG: PD40 domain-containing protein [Bacteroidales bacterium]|nr:PD40 domain-containing protein [Bacteroidales bacterium]
MMRNLKYILLTLPCLLLSMQQSPGQFYNGHQMTFGKNRVQFNDFYWSYQRYEKFDTYFSEFGKNIAEYTAGYVENELNRLEGLFDYNLDQRIIFIIYNKLSDFRQSNIGLVTGNAENNIGGVTHVDQNKIFLYFEGDYRKLEKQISGAIVRVLVTEMIYGMNFKQKITSSTLVNLPDWYIDGLVAYFASGWDIQVENRVRDGILSKKYKKFSRLVDEDAKYAGQSFWKYIADSYGESVIPSILYLTKVNKNANIGFLYVLGSPLKVLAREWYAYYRDLYSDYSRLEEIPSEGLVRKRPKKKDVYQQVKMNPLGNYIAYVTNNTGQYKVWLQDLATGKRKRIVKKEYKLEQINDYSYPVLAWHPSGRILTFITEEKGGLKLYYYTFGEKELQERNFLYFEKVLDFSFSHDGTLMVLSAIRDGKTDIYVHNVAAGTNHQITDDIAVDLNPRFISDSKQIIFSSDRRSDSLSIATSDKKLAMTRDLFIHDYASGSDKLMRLADEPYINKASPIEVGNNKFISLSDRNGIVNRYYSKFDSAVSFVDTAVHYRYFAITNPLTDYPRNILAHDYDRKAGQGAEIIFKNGRYYTYTRELEDVNAYTDELAQTDFRIKLTRELAQKDSLQSIEITDIPLDAIENDQLIYKEDTIHFERPAIDINNYTFEIERLNAMNSKLRSENIPVRIIKEEGEEDLKVRIYQEAFYQNYFVSQVDFSFLSESYQAFTGGAVYFNPGVNMLMKVGTNDLFEDYKITGGIRVPLDFESSEFLLSFEDLKRQLDRQYVFHRQVFKHYGGDNNTEYIKTITNEFSTVYKWPFNQVKAVLTTLSLRDDRNVYLYDLDITKLTATLEKPDQFKLWAHIKPEFIFDNTRSLGINLLAGTRMKLFGEYYQQINGNFDYLFVLGADIRKYVVIHRNLIWATRFAASTSFGSAKLIYYLGGVDNWTNLTPGKYPTFIPLSEIRIDENANYAYQAVATNMRGFSQNIRNGNSFALLNTEIRWPIISYFANHPLSNTFLQNFQTVGFFDIGTAWSGLHPWSGKNAYDNDIIYQGPITIEIDADREPIVAGYGFGFRSKLFGYFVRLDWAWGIENRQVLPRMFYFSLSLDF